jgi:hypothetical protein
MRSLLLAAVAVAAFAAEGRGQQSGCAQRPIVVNSAAGAFSLDTVPGWLVTCSPSRDDSVLVVYRRFRDAARLGVAFMYVGVLSPSAAKPATFAQRLDDDAANRKRGVPDFAVTEQKKVQTKKGESATVRQYWGRSRDLYEMVAYIPRGPHIVVIGIKTQAEMPFLNALREFNLLVRSYAPAPQTKAK